jgi:hypothetical membrane protein
MFSAENGDRFTRIFPLILVVVAGIVLVWAAGRERTSPALPGETTAISPLREVGILMAATGVACSVALIRSGREARRMRDAGIALLLVSAISTLVLGIDQPTRLGDSLTTGRYVLLALAFLALGALALRWHGPAGGLCVIVGISFLAFLFLAVIPANVDTDTSLGRAIVEVLLPLLVLGVFPITAGALFTAASFDVV